MIRMYVICSLFHPLNLFWFLYSSLRLQGILFQINITYAHCFKPRSNPGHCTSVSGACFYQSSSLLPVDWLAHASHRCDGLFCHVPVQRETLSSVLLPNMAEYLHMNAAFCSAMPLKPPLPTLIENRGLFTWSRIAYLIDFKINVFANMYNVLYQQMKRHLLYGDHLVVSVSLKGLVSCQRLRSVGGVYQEMPRFEDRLTTLTQIPNGLSVSHVCPFVLLTPGLLSYWPDLGQREKSAQALFLMSHSTEQNRRSGEGKSTMPCNPVPPSSAS